VQGRELAPALRREGAVAASLLEHGLLDGVVLESGAAAAEPAHFFLWLSAAMRADDYTTA